MHDRQIRIRAMRTSAAVNPISTIGGLGLRAADQIWEKRLEFS